MTIDHREGKDLLVDLIVGGVRVCDIQPECLDVVPFSKPPSSDLVVGYLYDQVGKVVDFGTTIIAVHYEVGARRARSPADRGMDRH